MKLTHIKIMHKMYLYVADICLPDYAQRSYPFAVALADNPEYRTIAHVAAGLSDEIDASDEISDEVAEKLQAFLKGMYKPEQMNKLFTPLDGDSNWDFSVERWQKAVADGNTLEGYETWVQAEREEMERESEHNTVYAYFDFSEE